MIDKYTMRLRDRILGLEDEFIQWVRGLEVTRVHRGNPELPAVIKSAEIIARTLRATEPVILEEAWIQGAFFQRLSVACRGK